MSDTDLLRDISAKLSKLIELYEGARPPTCALRFQDVEAMGKLMPVLAANFPGAFAAWEVIDAAAQGGVLGANLRLVLGKRSAQQLGQLLARAAGHDMGGLTLRRMTSDANGARWQVVGNGAS